MGFSAKTTRLVGTSSLVALGLLGACTNAQLYHLEDIPNEPNKIAFTGQACTDNPAERSFPLKVVFLIDTSPDTNGNIDPAEQVILQTRRVSAVRDSVGVLRAADTSFALVRFGGDGFITPDDGTFTDNTALISEAAGALTVPMPCSAFDGCRRTSQALSLASSLVTGDLLSTARGPRSRTTYEIVLVQTGPADDGILSAQTSADCDEDCVLATRVSQLHDFVLDNGAADFRFHTLDITPLSSDVGERNAAKAQFTRMAFAGTGEYVPICRIDDATGERRPPGCSANSLSLLPLNIRSARNVLIRLSFIVSNLNARHTPDGAVPDSDADGLSDDEEIALGTLPNTRDTDADGIGDKVELLLSTVGLDPLVPNLPTVCESILDPVTTDTDGDGLTDCEEALLRLDATLFDSDADGIPDLIEFLAATNFLADDVLVDSDFDGVPNGVEIRAHSDPRSSDATSRAELSYLYREHDLGIRELHFSTQPREVSGVVVNDVSVGSDVGNGLLLYIQANPPVLAWRDPSDLTAGPGVAISQDGTYILSSSGDGVRAKQISITVTKDLLPPFSVDEVLRIDIAQRQCIDFRVRNVTLVPTQSADGQSAGHNDIRIYFGQVPRDTPSSFGIFRVAQFQYRFLPPATKSPDIADQPVENFRFVLFGE